MYVVWKERNFGLLFRRFHRFVFTLRVCLLRLNIIMCRLNVISRMLCLNIYGVHALDILRLENDMLFHLKWYKAEQTNCMQLYSTFHRMEIWYFRVKSFFCFFLCVRFWPLFTVSLFSAFFPQSNRKTANFFPFSVSTENAFDAAVRSHDIHCFSAVCVYVCIFNINTQHIKLCLKYTIFVRFWWCQP